ncbi:MAG: lysoplasmalogenase, partial [bacterium]|nr:lysoplasmalogenase [bacterium]
VGAVANVGRPMILLGALMFYVSDLAVARDRFVATGFDNRIWGLPLYYCGQLVLASTIAG